MFFSLKLLTGAPFSPAGPGGPWGPGRPGNPMGPAVPADPRSPGEPCTGEKARVTGDGKGGAALGIRDPAEGGVYSPQCKGHR